MWVAEGHDKAVELLDRSLRNGKLAHAYLFVGPPHVGKMRLAIDLAKALNCEGQQRPCGQCTQCMRIEGLKHADVHVIGVDGRTEIGIDQMREMQHAANLKPFEGRHRVFVIDGAEHLSHEATNCLLKTLEEPPPDVQLILLTSNERLLLGTVLSRCQRLELRRLPVATVHRALTEQRGLGEEKARMLAQLCGGCLGWAFSVADDDGVLQERSERLASLIHLHRAGRAERLSYAADLASQFARNRASVREVLALWMGWWRDLLLTREGCVDYIGNVDQREKLQEEALSYSLKGTKAFLESLRQAMAQLEQNANPRLVLEVLMLSMPTRKGD
jgi:DNA polymerase-3 subunit delta'